MGTIQRVVANLRIVELNIQERVMKQVSQNYKTGQIRVEDVEEPALKSGGVLVRTLQCNYTIRHTGNRTWRLWEHCRIQLKVWSKRP